jgi:hypothetical protein
MSIVTAEVYRDVMIHEWTMMDDADAPKSHPYYVSGEFWLTDQEDTYHASGILVREVNRRLNNAYGTTYAHVVDDSEFSCFFFNADTVESMRALIDLLHGQGRIRKPQKPPRSRALDAVLELRQTTLEHGIANLTDHEIQVLVDTALNAAA